MCHICRTTRVREGRERLCDGGYMVAMGGLEYRIYSGFVEGTLGFQWKCKWRYKTEILNNIYQYLSLCLWFEDLLTSIIRSSFANFPYDELPKGHSYSSMAAALILEFLMDQMTNYRSQRVRGVWGTTQQPNTAIVGVWGKQRQQLWGTELLTTTAEEGQKAAEEGIGFFTIYVP